MNFTYKKKKKSFTFYNYFNYIFLFLKHKIFNRNITNCIVLREFDHEDENVNKKIVKKYYN